MNSPGIEARFRLSKGAFTLDVDLAFPNRGVTALFGPSGSGKTTVLRLIAGLDRAAEGFLSVGEEIWQNETHFLPTHERALGYVFQEANLFPHLCVKQNVEYGLLRVPMIKRRLSLDHAIGLLGIEHLLMRMPRSLSGGEKQRVGIARALATSPRLLLMDEPLAALDHARKKEIFPYLERLHNELAMPIIYVSHASDEIARLADYLVVLEAGKVVAKGSITQVFSRLDLPIHGGEEAGAVLMATVGKRDLKWHLARLDFPGGSLWARDHGIDGGNPVRVRVLARDVSLAVDHPTDSSILNILSGKVDAIHAGDHPAQALVRIVIGTETFLLARLTYRSINHLGLRPGATVWVQIKTIALLE